MRRPPHRFPRHHFPRRIGAARSPLAPVFLVLAAVLLSASVAIIIMLAAVLLTIAPLLLVGMTAMVITSARRRERRAMAHQHRAPRFAHRPAAPVPPSPPQPPRPTPDWAATRTRFDRLRSEYGQFECDPLMVLRLPALTDVSVPSTARFVDAFAEAQALQTDAEPPPEHHARFIAAVDQAWRSWHAALDAAERIRLSGIPAAERATVQRAIKLLTVARDSDHDAERSTAYAKVRAELAKLDRSGALRLPPTAAAALDAAARGQLPPAPPGSTWTGRGHNGWA